MSLVRLSFSVVFLYLSIFSLMGQASWQCHLARRETSQVCIAKERIFALGNGALYSVGRRDIQDIRLYDKTSGLSDVQIEQIAYSPDTETLIIYYRSGNIDLMTAGGIVSIPTLMQSPRISQYEIHQMLVSGASVYLAGRFGLARVDLSRQKLMELAPQDKNITSVAYSEESKRLVILAEGSLYETSSQTNLQDPSNWNIIYSTSNPELKQIAFLGERLLALSVDGRLYEVRGGELQLFPITLSSQYSNIESHPLGLVLTSSVSLTLLHTDLSIEVLQTPTYQNAVWNTQGSEVWLARGVDGLTRIRPQTTTPNLDVKPRFNAPTNNSFLTLRAEQGRLYAISKGETEEAGSSLEQIHLFDTYRWTNIQLPNTQEISTKSTSNLLEIIPHRDRIPEHYYVVGWGTILWEMQGDRLLQKFNIPGVSSDNPPSSLAKELRIGSLNYDAKGNLWMTKGVNTNSSDGSILHLSPTASWGNYNYIQLQRTQAFGPLAIFQDGTKWLAEEQNPSGEEGYIVIKDKGTESALDDVVVRYTQFRESSGKIVPIAKVYALTIDRTGRLWVGSNIGYFSVANPMEEPVIGRPPLINRPTGEQGETAYYLLDNIAVRAIAVDRYNRKWLGTEQDGLYLVSEDGRQILRHFRAEDTPLLSNQITALAYDDNLGLLYIVTSKGLNSYDTATGISVDTSISSSLLVSPNPLRPNDSDIIRIDKLPAGATIRIFNTSGQMIHQGESIDGSYEWSTLDRSGRRVPTGVYHIVVTPQEGNPLKTSVAIVRE